VVPNRVADEACVLAHEIANVTWLPGVARLGFTAAVALPPEDCNLVATAGLAIAGWEATTASAAEPEIPRHSPAETATCLNRRMYIPPEDRTQIRRRCRPPT
jgi:hypothetical protein